MTTKTINLTLTVTIKDTEDYELSAIMQVIQDLAQFGIDSDMNMADSIKEEILDNIINFSISSPKQEALLNLAKAVDNHDKSYGDTNWRNQACAQLEIAQHEACEALGLDPWANLWYDENNRQVKVGE